MPDADADTGADQDFEAFKNLALAGQGVFFIIAVVFGGIWTITEFNATQRVRRAQIESTQQSVLNLTLEEIRSVEVADSTGYLVFCTVVVRNTGNRSVTLNYGEDPPLKVYEVTLTDGFPRLRKVTETSLPTDGSERVISHAISPNETAKIPFVAFVRRPGLHYIKFKISMPAEEREALDNYEESLFVSYYSTAESYLWISE